jgi:hypothetical protein
MKFKKIISGNTEKFILFVGGIVVSAVISSLLEGIISWSEVVLIATTILLVVASIFYFSQTHQTIEGLTSKAETTVYYVEEAYREREGIKYKGAPYTELTRLVDEAKNEVLTLSTSNVDDGRGRITDTHSSRSDYFETLEKNILRHRENGFKYVRIQQVPREGANEPIAKFISSVTANHYRRIINLERSLQTEKISLSIMKVPTQRVTSFIIIDRQYVLIIIDGIDMENRSYPAGMFVLEDRGGRLVEQFVHYFENLERLAHPITLAEIEAN